MRLQYLHAVVLLRPHALSRAVLVVEKLSVVFVDLDLFPNQVSEVYL